MFSLYPVVMLKNVISSVQASVFFYTHSAVVTPQSCIIAACSSIILSDISEGLCGMSHPISLQFSPEIGFELQQRQFIPFCRPFFSS